MKHPNLISFIHEWQQEAAARRSYRHTIGTLELYFLEHIWGPAMQWDFNGLTLEYPFKDFKGGSRYADVVYINQGIRIVIELDGFTTHARDISPGEFDDHMYRQNDLLLSGCFLLRFTKRLMERSPEICRRQLVQAIGHWWTLRYGSLNPKLTNIWSIRKQYIVQLAAQRQGYIKPCEVAAFFEISQKSAADWLKRYCKEGILVPALGTKRITSYQLHA